MGRFGFALTISALALAACTSSGDTRGTVAETEGASDESTANSKDVSQPAPENSAAASALSRDWKANGFAQLDAKYGWAGYAENASLVLAVPETDDIVWTATCADAKVKHYILMASPDLKKGDKTAFQIGIDDQQALSYPVEVVALPFGEEGDGGDNGAAPLVTQSINDPMLDAMSKGTWAYIVMGEGKDAVRERISLAGAGDAITEFRKGCKAN